MSVCWLTQQGQNTNGLPSRHQPSPSLIGHHLQANTLLEAFDCTSKTSQYVVTIREQIPPTPGHHVPRFSRCRGLLTPCSAIHCPVDRRNPTASGPHHHACHQHRVRDPGICRSFRDVRGNTDPKLHPKDRRR